MKTIKTIKLIGAAVALALGSLGAVGQTVQSNYTFSVNEAVPANNVLGLTLAENLTLPSNLSISSVEVGLDISGGYNGDLYAYLAGPDGGFAVLLNRVGVSNSASEFGYSDSGMNVNFEDSAANDIHYYQNVPGYSLTGTIWQPDGENIDPNSPPADFTGTQTAMLSSFDGANPNGTWTLFLADVSSGSQSTVVSWSLDITMVPEPSILTFAGAGVVVLLILGQRRSRRNGENFTREG